MILNLEVFIEIFEVCIVKLSSIIRYEHAGHPKPAHDVFPDEVLNILLCDNLRGQLVFSRVFALCFFY